MKRVLGLVLFFAALWAGAAFAGGQDFVLVNNTGADIHVVNISPSNSNDWEEDVLGSDVLGNGEYVTVNFNAGNQRNWDIQAVFENGSSISWYEIDLLSTSVVKLNGDGTATLE
jgi:hypothetical protein